MFASFTAFSLAYSGASTPPYPIINPLLLYFLLILHIIGVYKPKTSRREHSPTRRADVISRWKAGYAIPQIIELENLPRSTIQSIIDRLEERGRVSYYNKPRLGPELKTTDRDNRALL